MVDRIAVTVIEREFAYLQDGALEVTLPDGGCHRFGSVDPVRIRINDRYFFRWIATRGKVGFGES